MTRNNRQKIEKHGQKKKEKIDVKIKSHDGFWVISESVRLRHDQKLDKKWETVQKKKGKENR